jgi:methylmalonyl-CoA/ethylmalonyl-CoA epimerase
MPLSKPVFNERRRGPCAIHSLREALAGRGVKFEAEPRLLAKMPDHELWMAFFRDPSNNLLALMCEKRP